MLYWIHEIANSWNRQNIIADFMNKENFFCQIHEFCNTLFDNAAVLYITVTGLKWFEQKRKKSAKIHEYFYSKIIIFNAKIDKKRKLFILIHAYTLALPYCNSNYIHMKDV